MSILDSLTDAQRKAVECLEGPLLILAGPGSGKTRVITHRIANLVEQGVHPRLILALTFTNKAADEMKDRVQRLVPDASVWIGTFHRFCARLLRRHAEHVGLDSNFTIYDMSDSRAAMKRAIASLDVPPTMTSPERIANHISWLKNHLITAANYRSEDGKELSAIVKEVYPAYQSELVRANAVDFDDLLLHIVTLLRESPEVRASLDETYRYIMVDEYQDTNLAQYAIVRAISNDFPNLAVTGDPDQAIYGWRGANLRNILDFEQDYPNVQVARLEQNYRSTPNILRAASQLIQHNQQRKHKELFTDREDGAPVQLAVYETQNEEAEGIVADIERQVRAGRSPSDFAIFYRVNALSRALEHALSDAMIPYQIVNGVEFYQRKEIKDVMAYLHLIHNPADNGSLARIINVPARRIGKTTVDRLSNFAREQQISMLEAARNADTITTLGKAVRPKLKAFAGMIDELIAISHRPLEEILGQLLTKTQYLDSLVGSDRSQDEDRVANVEELLSEARDFDERNTEPDALGAYLERVSLVNDVDAWDEGKNHVTLMTLHAAKGLEFPVVYLIGVEQGLIPHERSLGSLDQEEEERRLLFVGITRAMDQLQLSRVLVRAKRGGINRVIPSQFLMELPRHEMQQIDSVQKVQHVDLDEFPSYDLETGHLKRPVSEDEHAYLSGQTMSDSAELDSDDTHETAMSQTEQDGSIDPGLNNDPFDQGPVAHDDLSSSVDTDAKDSPPSVLANLRPASEMVEANGEDANAQDATGGHQGVEQDGTRLHGTTAPHSTAGQGESSAPPSSSASPADGTTASATVLDPNVFQIGMTVIHPEYGPGKIAAISGKGKRRTGVINFPTSGQKRIVLAFSKLRPVTAT